jgi:hypothetical protein
MCLSISRVGVIVPKVRGTPSCIVLWLIDIKTIGATGRVSLRNRVFSINHSFIINVLIGYVGATIKILAGVRSGTDMTPILWWLLLVRGMLVPLAVRVRIFRGLGWRLVLWYLVHEWHWHSIGQKLHSSVDIGFCFTLFHNVFLSRGTS